MSKQESVEKQIEKIETLLDSLESDDIDLETAAQQYADALKLISKSASTLKKTEAKIKVLQEKGKDIIEKEL